MSNLDNYTKMVNLNNLSGNKTTYKEIIDKQGFYIATPVGTSMMPLIRERIDTVRLEKPKGRCKKYDVIMYQRKNGIYVLHRIMKVKKDSYVLCGDNQAVLERGVTDDMIIGVMTGFYRGDTYVSVDNPEYIKYYKKRVSTRLYRFVIYSIKRVTKKLLKK